MADAVDVPVVLYATGLSGRFGPVVHALRRSSVGPIIAGGAAAETVVGADAIVASRSCAELVRSVHDRYGTHMLVVGEPVLVPPALLERALGFVEADQRVATVSFLSNAAGLASFPHRATPVGTSVSGHDAASITRRLRDLAPAFEPVSLPIAGGGIALLSSWALGLLDEVAGPPSGSFAGFLAEFSAAAMRRGLVSVLDAGTYVHHAGDLASPAERGTLTGADLDWIGAQHPFLPAMLDHERTAPDSALGLALQTARAKVLGLSVTIDGSCLGPTEMGTQVGLVALTAALAERDDVRHVQVTVPGPVPAYARHLLGMAKVSMHRVTGPADLGGLEPADVLYRPFHPDAHFRPRELRAAARRIAVGVLDLIAYQIGAYFENGETWLAYRREIERAVAEVDAVTTISDDVRDMIAFERLPIDPTRVVSVPYGTQHLTGNEPSRPPAALSEVLAASTFLVCLGTNYSHKNRDVAIRTHADLRARGHDLVLVLVGASVPFGSSRLDEARALTGGGVETDVVTLPDVASEERNWLLRHAAAVLYPTSAEGFGLVPFEAAQFGTPTVNVPFGPFREIAGSLPVEATDWTATALADAVERFLKDPSLAREQVTRLVEAGEQFTWQRTAARLTDLFRTLLWTPPQI